MEISFEMNMIDSLNDDFHQTFVYDLEDKSKIEFELVYRDRVKSWFFNKIVYGDYTIYNTRLVETWNLLPQYDNLFPFRIYISSRPRGAKDFVLGLCKIGILEF